VKSHSIFRGNGGKPGFKGLKELVPGKKGGDRKKMKVKGNIETVKDGPKGVQKDLLYESHLEQGDIQKIKEFRLGEGEALKKKKQSLLRNRTLALSGDMVCKRDRTAREFLSGTTVRSASSIENELKAVKRGTERKGGSRCQNKPK